MFENTRKAVKATVREPLQVQTTEDLLSNMTLERTPEILTLLSRILNLSEDDFDTPSIEDNARNVYRFTLIKYKGINRCLLKIPIEISTNQARNVFDIFERIKNALLLKYHDLYLYIIYDEKLDVSFKTNATIWKILHPQALRFVNFIETDQLLQLKEINQESCRIFLEKDFFGDSPELEVATSMRTAGARTKVFISYSHQDTDWLNRLHVHLKPLERDYGIDIWDDTKIKPGSKWREEIEKAVQSAKVVLLLVSANFLASDFITKNELPPLLSAAEKDGATILPVIISPCRFQQTKNLSQFQSVNPPSKPLTAMTTNQRDKLFVKVANEIEKLLNP